MEVHADGWQQGPGSVAPAFAKAWPLCPRPEPGPAPRSAEHLLHPCREGLRRGPATRVEAELRASVAAACALLQLQLPVSGRRCKWDSKATEKPGKPSLTIWETTGARPQSCARPARGALPPRVPGRWSQATGSARLNAPSMNLLGLNSAINS